MRKTTTSLETPLRAQLDRLTAFEPTDSPVISLYLDMQRDQQGRTRVDPFLRKVLPERAATLTGSARKSFEQDVERITAFLADEVERSTNGLAIFACHDADLFDTIQMTAPIDDHWLFVGAVPHLYPLARANDQYPRYAAVITDTNSARIFVLSLGAIDMQEAVQNGKTRKTAVGGWSQARYQRHVENVHEQHIKEVVDVLDRIVREESIAHIVTSGDDVARPLLMEHLPKHLAEKIVDTVHVNVHAPEHQILQATLEALRAKDAQTDAEHVEAMIGAWRGGGLAVAGPEDTLEALQMAQVEELLITAAPGGLRRLTHVPPGTAPGPMEVDTSAPSADLDTERLKLADALVTKAHTTGARVRFIEDPELLRAVGGVGALLRFKI